MSVDLDTLTALAKAATPGTRTVDCVKKAGEDEACFCGQEDQESDEIACKEPEKHLSPTADCYMIHGIKKVEQDEGWYYTREDAEFIAACSPDAILALVARVREVEAIVVEFPEGAMVTLQKWYTEKERAKKLEEVLRSAKVVVDGVADWFSDNPQLPKRIDDMLTPSEPT